MHISYNLKAQASVVQLDRERDTPEGDLDREIQVAYDYTWNLVKSADIDADFEEIVSRKVELGRMVRPDKSDENIDDDGWMDAALSLQDLIENYLGNRGVSAFGDGETAGYYIFEDPVLWDNDEEFIVVREHRGFWTVEGDAGPHISAKVYHTADGAICDVLCNQAVGENGDEIFMVTEHGSIFLVTDIDVRG